MGNTQPTLKAATVIKGRLKEQRARSQEREAAKGQGGGQASPDQEITTVDGLRRYMQQQSRFEWMFNGVEKTRDIIFHPDFTLTAGGKDDDKGTWKVTSSRTLVASFGNVQHVLQFDEGMKVATLVFPARHPPTKMRPWDEEWREREEEAKALANFEHFHQLPKGTAKLNWVKATKEGVEGWAKWTAEPPAAKLYQPPTQSIPPPTVTHRQPQPTQTYVRQIEEVQAGSLNQQKSNKMPQAAPQRVTLDQIKHANFEAQNASKDQAKDANALAVVELLLTAEPPQPMAKEEPPSSRQEAALGANADGGSKTVASDGDAKKERARARWNKVSANVNSLAPSRSVSDHDSPGARQNKFQRYAASKDESLRVSQEEARAAKAEQERKADQDRLRALAEAEAAAKAKKEEEQKISVEKQIKGLNAGNTSPRALTQVKSLPVIERWVPPQATEPQLKPSEVRPCAYQYPFPTYFFDSIVTDKKVDDELLRVSAIQRHNQDQVRQLATLTRNLKYVESHGSLKALQAIRRNNDDAVRRLEELKNRRLNDPSPPRLTKKRPLYDDLNVLPTVNTDIAQEFLPKVNVNEVTGLIGEQAWQQEPNIRMIKPETQKRAWKYEVKVEEKKEEPTAAVKKGALSAPREKSVESDKISIVDKKLQQQKFTQKQKLILQQQMQLEQDVSPQTSKETVDLKTKPLATIIQDYRLTTEGLSTVNVDEISVKENAAPNLSYMPPSTVQSIKTLKKPKESLVLVTKDHELIIPQSQSKLENFRTVKQNKDMTLFREKPESRQGSRQGTRMGMRGQHTLSRPSSQASGQSSQKTLDRSYFPDINQKKRMDGYGRVILPQPEQKVQKQKMVSTSVDHLPNQGKHQRNLTVQYESYNAYENQAQKDDAAPMQPKEERNRNSGRKGLHTQMKSMKAIPTEYQHNFSTLDLPGSNLKKPKNQHSISLPKLNHADLGPEERPQAKQLKEKSKRPSMVPSLPQALLEDSRNLPERWRATDGATSKTQGDGLLVMKTIQEQEKGSLRYKKVKVNEIRQSPVGKAVVKAEHGEGRAKVYVMQSAQKKKQQPQAMDKDTLKQRLALDLTPINNMKEAYVTRPKQRKESQQNGGIKEVQFQQELQAMNKAQQDASDKPGFLEKKAVPVVKNQPLVIDQQLKVVDEKAPIAEKKKPQIIDKQIQIMNQRTKELEQKLAEMDKKPTAVLRMPDKKPIVLKKQRNQTIVHSPERAYSWSEHSTERQENKPHHSMTIKKTYQDAKIFELQNTRGKVYIASQEPHSIGLEMPRAAKPKPKAQEVQKAVPETLKLENQKTVLVKMPVKDTFQPRLDRSAKKKEPQDSPEKQPAKALVKESPIKPQVVQKQPVKVPVQSQPSRGPAEKEPQDSPEKDCAKAPVKQQPAIAPVQIKAPAKKQPQQPPKQSYLKVPIKEKQPKSPPKVEVKEKPTKPPGKAPAKELKEQPADWPAKPEPAKPAAKVVKFTQSPAQTSVKFSNGSPSEKAVVAADTNPNFDAPFSSSDVIDANQFLIKMPNGDRGLYTGQMKREDCLPHGKGTCIFDKGLKYVGCFQDGRYEGQGTFYWGKDHYYKGQWMNHMMHGTGKYKYQYGATYNGEWKHDKKSGKGEYTMPDGYRYLGEYKGDMKYGYGVEEYAKGGPVARYDGYYKNDQRHGKGLLIFSNDDEYEGYFVNGAREGLGEMRTAATGEKWFGTWKQGQKHGEGTRTQADGKTIKAIWQEGKRLKEEKIGF